MMDPFLGIVVFVVFCILFSICGWCCKKKQEGVVYGYGTQPQVTITAHPTNTVPSNFPVATGNAHSHVPVGSVPGFTYQDNAPYPLHSVIPGGSGYGQTAPYPPAPGHAYQTPGAPYPTGAPYPPVAAPPQPAQQLPPPYSEAVNQPRVPVDPYTKQAPYNPHF